MYPPLSDSTPTVRKGSGDKLEEPDLSLVQLEDRDVAEIERRVAEELDLVSPEVQRSFQGDKQDKALRELQGKLRAHNERRKDDDGATPRKDLTRGEEASTGWALLPMQAEYEVKDRGGEVEGTKDHFKTKYLFETGDDLALRGEQQLGNQQEEGREQLVLHFENGTWLNAHDTKADTTKAGPVNQSAHERRRLILGKISDVAEELSSINKRIDKLEERVTKTSETLAELQRLRQRVQQLGLRKKLLNEKNKGSNLNRHRNVTGKHIFVMNSAGQFFAAPNIDYVLHHSSFLAGGAVAAAGEISIANGQVTSISNQSGHYRPGPVYLWQAVKQLQLLGCDLSSVSVTVSGVPTRFRNALTFLLAMDPTEDPRWFDATWAVEQLKVVGGREREERRRKRAEPSTTTTTTGGEQQKQDVDS